MGLHKVDNRNSEVSTASGKRRPRLLTIESSLVGEANQQTPKQAYDTIEYAKRPNIMGGNSNQSGYYKISDLMKSSEIESRA